MENFFFEEIKKKWRTSGTGPIIHACTEGKLYLSSASPRAGRLRRMPPAPPPGLSPSPRRRAAAREDGGGGATLSPPLRLAGAAVRRRRIPPCVGLQRLRRSRIW